MGAIMVFKIQVENKQVEWTDKKVTDKLTSLAGPFSAKKTTWIKTNLNKTEPGLIRKALFSILGKISWIRKNIFQIDPQQSEKILNQIRVQIEQSQDNEMIKTFNVAVGKVGQINSQINVKSIALPGTGSVKPPKAVPLIQRSGIANVGNSCFFASALQVLAHFPAYRNAFDPQLNPLVKQEDETDLEFMERQTLQTEINLLLNKIVAGDKTLDIQATRKKIASLQGNKGHEGGDATAALNDMLALVDFHSDAYKLSSLGWEIMEPCSEAEKSEIEKEVESYLLDYQEPTTSFRLIFNKQDKQANLPALFEEQYINRKIRSGNPSDEFPMGKFTIKLKSSLLCIQPDIPLMINFATEGHDPFFPLLPLIWTSSDSSSYQLESVIVAGLGHATVFHRDQDGSFVHFNDDSVKTLSKEDAKKIFDNHAVTGIYKKIS